MTKKKSYELTEINKKKESKSVGNKSSKLSNKPKPKTLIGFVLKNTNCFDKLLLLFGFLLCVVGSALYPSAVWLYGRLVNTLVDYSIDLKTIKSLNDNLTSSNGTNSTFDVYARTYEYIFYYVYFGFPVFVAHFLAYVCWGITAERIAIRLRSILYESIIRQDMIWFDSKYKFEQTNALFKSIDKLKLGIGEKLCDFIVLSLRAVSCSIFSFYSCWKLAFAFSSVFPLSTLFFIITVKMSRKYSIKESDLSNKATSILHEVIGSIKTVLAFNGQNSELSKYGKIIDSLKDVVVKKGLILGVTSGLSTFFGNGGYVIYIAYGTFLQTYESGVFNAGLVMQCFSSYLLASVAINQAFPFVKEFSEANYAFESLIKVIDEEKPQLDVLDDKTGMKLQDENIKGDLSIKNLSFFYSSRPQQKILKNLNLEIKSGKTVAIIGQSGCGKTTLIKLLTRIYDPQEGQINFDGYNINSLNLNWWRNKISIVSQDSVVFKMSLKENIKIGMPNATDEQVFEAARAARIDELIINRSSDVFKNGYDTIIEQNKLSGGQRQLISLARAFLKNNDPNIRFLIFDEATSALDNETEVFIKNSILKIRNETKNGNKPKTMIIIAHRLSTIRDVDLIVIMSNGQIVNSGSHDELINSDAYYKNMVEYASNQSNNDDAHVDKSDLLEIKIVDTKENLMNSNKPKITSAGAVDAVNNANSLTSSTIDSSKKLIYSSFSMAKRIWSFNKTEWFWIICSAIGYFIQGSMYPFIAYCFSEMVRLFIYYNDNIELKNSQSYMLSGIVIALCFLSFVAVFLQYYATIRAGAQLTCYVKKLLLKSLLIYHPMSWFDKNDANSKSSLVYGIDTNAPILKSYTVERLGLIMNSISGLGIPLGISFYYSWKLTLVLGLFIPVALVWGFMQGQLIRGTSRASGQVKYDESIKLSDETIRNIQTLNSLSIHRYFADKLKKLYKSNFNKTCFIVFLEGFFYSLGYILYFFCQVTVFSYGSYLLKNNEIEAFNIIRIFVSLLCSSTFVAKNVSLMPDITKAKKAAKWIFNIIDSEDHLDSTTTTTTSLLKNIDLNGPIQFENVNFDYHHHHQHQQSTSTRSVLKQVNLNFKPEKSTALVGTSGCGKSTIVSLIEGFYKPSNGRILINGHDLTQIDPYWLRSKIGFVFQEPILFTGTIKENIAYGLDENAYSMNDIINAANDANADQFIRELPQGYDTHVSHSNNKLSGGQKQRIAIARALIRKPNILILDEATSSLDGENERMVQNAIDKAVSQGRLSIIIAHRLSTIHNCDNIYVMKEGQVIEEGNHLALMQSKGFYYKLNNIHQMDHANIS